MSPELPELRRAKPFMDPRPAFGWGLVLLLSIVGCCMDVISPADETLTTIHVLKRRILVYANAHGQLPKNLDNVPRIKGKINRLCDEWGKKIIYTVNPDNTVTLTSYGRDGREGGAGDDTDLTGVFNPKRSDGSWDKPNSIEWLLDPVKDYQLKLSMERKESERF